MIRLGAAGPVALAAWAAACQPGPGAAADEACDPDPPPAGEVVVAPLACDERIVPGGDGRRADWWLANAWMRVVVRDPATALSVPAVGGGTLIDAAPWGTDDEVYEVVPLVGGGWLDVDEFEPLADGVRVAGTVRALPARPAPGDGQPGEITWRIEPDGPFVRADGAEGFYVHGLGTVEVVGGQLVGAAVIGHDGEVEDLGGALWVTGTDRLVVSTAAEAWAWQGPTVRAQGDAPDASTLVAYADDAVIARVPVVDGAFDVALPAATDAVRAEATDRAPSARVAPGTGLSLAVGAPGRIDVSITWDGRPRPARVAWSAADGRRSAFLTEPTGGGLALGAGTYDLVVSAGPAWGTASASVQVPTAGDVAVDVHLEPRFDPGARVAATVRSPAERSRTWRGTDLRAVRSLAAAGLDFAVLTPEDDVPSGSATDGDVGRRNGTLLTHPDGWTVSAWPWSASSHSAHGAPAIAALSPEDALAAARGGPGVDRFTVVDRAWLAAAGPPWTVDPQPDFAWLDDADDLADWARWLDAGVDLVPVGRVTWVDVIDPDLVVRAEVEQGLVRGHVCAGDGGLVTLTVGDVGPGELSEGGRLAVAVRSGADPFDHLVVIGSDGAVVLDTAVDGGTLDLQTDVALPATWVAAVATGASGAWAVTGPVWLGATRPGDG